MLLVLIGLGAATILTVAYLSSRDNSAEIGRNVAESAAARWAAVSGIDLTTAVMETDTEWRTEHNNGVLFQNYPLGDAFVTVELTDLKTNLPPDASSRYIKVTSRGIAGGVEQVVTAMATVGDFEDHYTVSVDLSEFSVFAVERIELENQGLIARWPSSPLYDLGSAIYFGTQATDAFSIELKEQSAVIDGTVYHLEGASGSLINDDGSLRTVELLDLIPVPDPPTPDVDPPSGENDGNLATNSATVIDGQAVRYETIDMWTQNGVISAKDSVIIVDDTFTLQQDSGMTIEGDVTLIVFGTVSMGKHSYIELKPDATLRMFAKDGVSLTDAFIGEERDDKKDRDNSGYAEWIDTGRILIYSIMDEDALQPLWEMRNNSVVKAQVYAPNTDFRIRDHSALYGRAAVRRLRIRNQGAIFYDPVLDTTFGYTNHDSMLYDEDGSIRNEFKDLANLTAQALTQLAEALNLNILGGNYSADAPMPPLKGVFDGLAADDPTPRVVSVEYELTTFGDDVQSWEEIYQRTNPTVIVLEGGGAESVDL